MQQIRRKPARRYVRHLAPLFCESFSYLHCVPNRFVDGFLRRIGMKYLVKGKLVVFPLGDDAARGAFEFHRRSTVIFPFFARIERPKSHKYFDRGFHEAVARTRERKREKMHLSFGEFEGETELNRFRLKPIRRDKSGQAGKCRT